MKLRKLIKEIYVSASAQRGWSAKSINRKVEILQYQEKDGSWVDVPTVTESIDIYSDSTAFSSDNYRVETA